MKNNSSKEYLHYSGKVIFTDVDIKTSFKNRTTIKKWLSDVLKKEGYELGELDYNFCSDENL